MGGQKAKKSRNLEDQNAGNTETEPTEYPRSMYLIRFYSHNILLRFNFDWKI